jgi:serine/threonine protein kinase
MGEVYRVEDKKVGQEIALKLIKPEISANRKTIERFRHELKTARMISHRNVCRMFDLGVEKGTYFITMEYVAGEDLKSFLRRSKQLALGTAISIAKQICEGLTEAHRLGVVHRDLKPGNIMIDKEGNARIMDFGIARSPERKGITGEGMMIGTPEYMSPEQVEGKEVDQRSDIYSLGIILYEMVTGRVPFEGQTPLSIAVKHKNEFPKDPRELNAQVPQELSRIILTCLKKAKEERYQNVELVYSELGRIETSSILPVDAISKTKTLRLKKIRIKKLSALTLVAIVVIFSFFIVWRFILYKPKPEISKETSKKSSESVRLLVADFQNKTGEQVFSGAFEKAVSTGLSNASFISIYPREEARKRVNQIDASAEGHIDGLWAQLVSRNAGISILVDGSITKNSEGYIIEAWALDPINSVKIAETSRTIKTRAEALGASDRIAAEIAEQLRLMLQYHLYSTHSLAALKAYEEGRALAKIGKHKESIQQYMRAIEIDPNFGEAYAGVAFASFDLGDWQLAEKYVKEAFDRIDQMSDREKYKLRASYYLMKGDMKKAIDEYQALLKQFPSDSAGQKDLLAARSNLALAYFASYKFQEAFKEGLLAVEQAPNNPNYRYNQSWYALAYGDFDKARQEAQKTIDINPSSFKASIVLALVDLAQGHPAEAAKQYQKLEVLSPPLGASIAAAGFADLAIYQGRLNDAISILKRGIAVDMQNKSIYGSADKSVMLARAYLLQGKKQLAVEAADQAIKTYKREDILFAAAQIYIEAGEEAKARNIGGELSKKVRDMHLACAKLIGGDMSLQRGDTANARKLFGEAQGLVDTWLGRFALGRAYLQAGAFTEALSEFEKCEKRKGEATSIFQNDLPTFRYLDSLYYYLGRAQEGSGNKAAKESYLEFLKIKEKADPGLPEVEDARKRLAGLKTP